MSIDNSRPLEQPSTSRTPIWNRSPEEVAKWSSTLSRVTSIYCQMPLTIYHKEDDAKIAPHKRSYPSLEVATEAHQKIVNDRNNFHEELTSQNYPQEQASSKLSEVLIGLPKELVHIYTKDFTEIQGDLAARISRLSKDFFSASSLSIKESFLGNDGVLLLRQTRSGLDNITKWTEESVLKWTNPLEAASGDILRVFLDDIYVQQTSVLDFSQKSHIKNDSKDPISEELSRSIQKDLRSVRKNFSDKTAETNNIMLAERLAGTDLADFVSNRWSTLSEEHKAAIFQGIGKLTLADLIIGNTDRFTAFKSNSEGFITTSSGDEDLEDACFSANIGNLMIQEPNDAEKLPILCAIDNGIPPENLVGGDEYEQYNQSLKNLFKPDWKEKTAIAIQTSIANSFSEGSFYLDQKKLSPEKKIRLAPILLNFIQDLKSNTAQAALIQGLTDAEASLSLKFGTAEFNSSLETIKTRYAKPAQKKNQIIALDETVKNRIDLFLNK